MTTRYAIVEVKRCKDCPQPCDKYESSWNIPDECELDEGIGDILWLNK